MDKFGHMHISSDTKPKQPSPESKYFGFGINFDNTETDFYQTMAIILYCIKT